MYKFYRQPLFESVYDFPGCDFFAPVGGGLDGLEVDVAEVVYGLVVLEPEREEGVEMRFPFLVELGVFGVATKNDGVKVKEAILGEMPRVLCSDVALVELVFLCIEFQTEECVGVLDGLLVSGHMGGTEIHEVVEEVDEGAVHEEVLFVFGCHGELLPFAHELLVVRVVGDELVLPEENHSEQEPDQYADGIEESKAEQDGEIEELVHQGCLAEMGEPRRRGHQGGQGRGWELPRIHSFSKLRARKASRACFKGMRREWKKCRKVIDWRLRSTIRWWCLWIRSVKSLPTSPSSVRGMICYA